MGRCSGHVARGSCRGPVQARSSATGDRSGLAHCSALCLRHKIEFSVLETGRLLAPPKGVGVTSALVALLCDRRAEHASWGTVAYCFKQGANSLARLLSSKSDLLVPMTNILRGGDRKLETSQLSCRGALPR